MFDSALPFSAYSANVSSSMAGSTVGVTFASLTCFTSTLTHIRLAIVRLTTVLDSSEQEWYRYSSIARCSHGPRQTSHHPAQEANHLIGMT